MYYQFRKGGGVKKEPIPYSLEKKVSTKLDVLSNSDQKLGRIVLVRIVECFPQRFIFIWGYKLMSLILWVRGVAAGMGAILKTVYNEFFIFF